VAIQHVSRNLRHKDIRTTMKTSGHLVVEDVRPALDGLPAVAEPARVPVLSSSLLRVKEEGPEPEGKPSESGPSR
jgi:hypothetical protein